MYPIRASAYQSYRQGQSFPIRLGITKVMSEPLKLILFIRIKGMIKNGIHTRVFVEVIGNVVSEVVESSIFKVDEVRPIFIPVMMNYRKNRRGVVEKEMLRSKGFISMIQQHGASELILKSV